MVYLQDDLFAAQRVPSGAAGWFICVCVHTHTLPPSCLGSFASELLLPGESLQSFPLAEVTPLSTSIPLTTFNIQRPVGHQGPQPVNLTHYVLTKDLALNATSANTMRAPVLLQSSSVFVGDPLASKRTVLDLAGLSSMPDASGTVPGCPNNYWNDGLSSDY